MDEVEGLEVDGLVLHLLFAFCKQLSVVTPEGEDVPVEGSYYSAWVAVDGRPVGEVYLVAEDVTLEKGVDLKAFLNHLD